MTETQKQLVDFSGQIIQEGKVGFQNLGQKPTKNEQKTGSQKGQGSKEKQLGEDEKLLKRVQQLQIELDFSKQTINQLIKYLSATFKQGQTNTLFKALQGITPFFIIFSALLGICYFYSGDAYLKFVVGFFIFASFLRAITTIFELNKTRKIQSEQIKILPLLTRISKRPIPKQ